MVERKRITGCNLKDLSPYERLTCDILENARRPLTTNEVAVCGNMSWLTAKKHLSELKKRDIGICSYKKGIAWLWYIE